MAGTQAKFGCLTRMGGEYSDCITTKSDALQLTDHEFKNLLLDQIPRLRAFAYTLTHGRGADDLCQETLRKAWEHRGQFHIGTNFAAWVCRILRNQFYDDVRRAQPFSPLNASAERLHVTPPCQAKQLELQDVMTSLHKLPELQREALVLTALAELSYDEAAKVMGCAVGTIKSRVSRARAMLSERLFGDCPEDALLQPALNRSQQRLIER
jgi:RNA polymerase sigma-70 factor, ECF subfamily